MKLPKFLRLADPIKTYRDCLLEALEEMHCGDNPRISDEAYANIKNGFAVTSVVMPAATRNELFSRATELLDYYQNGWHSRLAKRWILIALGLCHIFVLILLCVKFGVLR